MKNEIMEEEQFKLAMEDAEVTMETLEEMVAEKRRKSAEENEARARHIKELEEKRAREREREKITRDFRTGRGGTDDRERTDKTDRPAR